MNNETPSRPAERAANTPRFLLFLICLFASAGQLAIDIYVPALPAMAHAFGASPQAIRTSTESTSRR